MSASSARATTPPVADQLAGTWRLEAYDDLDEAGRVSTGPLGTRPEGLLLYQPHGFMSVSMMPGDGPSAAADFMGYAGRWRIAGGRVVHEITVASHPHLVHSRQVRDAVLDGDALTLEGTSYLHGRPVRRRLTWRRVPCSARRREDS
ncbi:lipocalin-like domain-containing protein [Streptomyces nodosus]|uniref:lipocalin-like domain-containing protein n=1 Tax=Streptomyces nodosus TaxID=40318 RepID=UPI0037FCA865